MQLHVHILQLCKETSPDIIWSFVLCGKGIQSSLWRVLHPLSIQYSLASFLAIECVIGGLYIAHVRVCTNPSIKKQLYHAIARLFSVRNYNNCRVHYFYVCAWVNFTRMQ